MQKAVTGAQAAVEISPVRNPQKPTYERAITPIRSPRKAKAVDFSNVSPSRQVTNRNAVRSPKKRVMKTTKSPGRNQR